MTPQTLVSSASLDRVTPKAEDDVSSSSLVDDLVGNQGIVPGSQTILTSRSSIATTSPTLPTSVLDMGIKLVNGSCLTFACIVTNA